MISPNLVAIQVNDIDNGDNQMGNSCSIFSVDENSNKISAAKNRSSIDSNYKQLSGIPISKISLYVTLFQLNQCDTLCAPYSSIKTIFVKYLFHNLENNPFLPVQLIMKLHHFTIIQHLLSFQNPIYKLQSANDRILWATVYFTQDSLPQDK